MKSDLFNASASRNVTVASRQIRAAVAVLAALLCALLLAASAQAQSLNMGKLKGDVWGSGNRNLVVILHGDGGPSGYDAYAKALAAAAKGTTVVTMVRPGFKGSAGRSPGSNRGKDHYTSGNNRSLAAALASMKASFKPGRLIVVGHSGGSGQLGSIIGQHPGIVDVAILAACPCNVPKWRVARRGKNNWNASQSPHRYAKKIPRSTKVIVITNKGDSNTRATLAREYAQLAQSAGANVTLMIPNGGSHRWSAYQSNVNAAIRQNLR